MDTIQAAILIEKMQLFDEELKEREDGARYYNKMLKNIVKVPYIIKGTRSAWAQYTIQVPNKKIREFLINNLKLRVSRQ